MPPKKKDAGANKKTQEKEKQKVVEDKTFGLKNKKGKKQQTYIKNVAQQVQGNKKKTEEAQPANKLSKREQEKQKLEELNALFKPVQQAQKVAAGVDPKSVLCSFYKQGHCGKGNKCKFSHDLSIERKSEKRSMYADERDLEKGTMDDWDLETLEDVVNKKHGASNAVKTEIVCKYFLEAIEKNLYGWFWNCPNGEKCIYRHALPSGYVLNKNKKKDDESEEDQVSLEEHIENERNQLSGNLTPVTLQSFLAWKKRKVEEKDEKYNSEMRRKKEDFKAGKALMKISGKEVFMFKPELADADDDEADDEFMYQRENTDVDDDAPCVEINLEAFAASSAKSSTDDTQISRVSTLLAKDRETSHAPTSTSYEQQTPVNDTSHTDHNGLDQACATPNEESPPAEIVIDESLFEDLDDLDIDD